MTQGPSTTTSSCDSPVVLFEASGSGSTFRNTWAGWYNSGYTVVSGQGKRSVYNTLAITRLRFSDNSGRFVEYALNPKYKRRTLLSIVQECIGNKRSNDGSSAWDSGLCNNVGKLRSKSGSFGRFSVSSVLRIGVGDTGSDRGDWALLMPLQGNGNGDYRGSNTWVFGGEDATNNGYSGTVTISATCGMLQLY